VKLGNVPPGFLFRFKETAGFKARTEWEAGADQEGFGGLLFDMGGNQGRFVVDKGEPRRNLITDHKTPHAMTTLNRGIRRNRGGLLTKGALCAFGIVPA
jgi:hypothetical protein